MSTGGPVVFFRFRFFQTAQASDETDLFAAKKATKAKVKGGKTKLAVKTRCTFLQGTSANKEGHNGTGLRGCRSIQALYNLQVIVVWKYEVKREIVSLIN